MTLRGLQTASTGLVVAVWAVVWVVAVVVSDPMPTLDVAVVFLVVPPLLWVIAARFVLRDWWSATGYLMAELDRPDRWRFALSSVRGMVVSAVRLRLPVPASLVVVGGVAAAIAVTVVFLRREPTADAYLPPAAAVYLAVVLVGCLCIALMSSRGGIAPNVGAAAGVAFAGWLWLIIRTDGTEPPLPVVLLLMIVLPLAPIAVFFVPAFAARRAGRSFRAGLRAAVWMVIVAVPLTYTLWLLEALRRYAIDGTSLMGEGERAPAGVNLTDALIFCLGIFPVLGLTLGIIAAGLGARRG